MANLLLKWRESRAEMLRKLVLDDFCVKVARKMKFQDASGLQVQLPPAIASHLRTDSQNKNTTFLFTLQTFETFTSLSQITTFTKS